MDGHQADPGDLGRCRGALHDHAARKWAGGLWAGAGYTPRCVRIFAMTSGCSMNARIRMVPAQRGQTSGSTSYTCLISRAQARFAVQTGISLNEKAYPVAACFPQSRGASVYLIFRMIALAESLVCLEIFDNICTYCDCF